MEKKRAHYSLEQVKEYVNKMGFSAFTLTARRNGFSMGLTQTEI